MERSLSEVGRPLRHAGHISGAGVPAQETKRRRMPRTAVLVGTPERRTFVPATGRSKSAEFNFGLLAALAACVAFWVLVALTASWLI